MPSDDEPTPPIVRGSMTLHNACNGYYIYGITPAGEEIYVGFAGTGDDEEDMARYDPNADPDLVEALGLTLVDPAPVAAPEASHE